MPLRFVVCLQSSSFSSQCGSSAPAGIKPMPYATTGLGYCGIDVTMPGTYTVTFSVSPSGAFSDPLQASVQRTIIVLSACPEGESECNGRCGKRQCLLFPFQIFSHEFYLFAAAVCAASSSSGSSNPDATASTAATASSPPAIVISGSSQVDVPFGFSYVRCLDGQTPTLTIPCEPGALATDPNDPSIQSRLLMCPEADCFASGCVGQRFIDRQPVACGIDTQSAIGSTFNLDFVVYNADGLSASVSRAITVVSPCATGQFLCSDGTCSNVSDLSMG